MQKNMNDEFAVFIMVWGRPDKMWTAKTLRNQGYTGKIYYVADDLDKTLPLYKEKYGDDLLVFSKEKIKSLYDAGDNTGDLRSTLYAANVIPELARERGVKYFTIYCDDYTRICYKHDNEFNYVDVPVKNLDKIFELMLKFYKKNQCVNLGYASTWRFYWREKVVKGKKNKIMA